MNKSNITLIGMPGVGKSTVGKELALKLKYQFVDVDITIEQRYGKKLIDILTELGEDKFIAIECEEIESLGEIFNSVISPGGSVIYSLEAMMSLEKVSKVFFLDADPELSAKRIELDSRGIVRLADRSYGDLYKERRPLYLKHADFVLNVDGLTVQSIVDQILKSVA